MTIGLALQSAQQSISSKDVEKDEVFEVVGGVGKGGIIVRSGCNTLSPELQQRLSTGARVRALEFQENENRLRYELLTGSGPPTGWVSTKVKDKDLLIQEGADITYSQNQKQEDKEIKSLPFAVFPMMINSEDGQSQQSTEDGLQDNFMLMSCFGGKIPKAAKTVTAPASDDKAKTKARATALQKYGELFAQVTKAEAQKQSGGVSRSAVNSESLSAPLANWHGHDELERDLGLEAGALDVEKNGATLNAPQPALGHASRQVAAQAHDRRQRSRWHIEFAMAQDSDGEEVQLCHHCRMDLGKHGYERHGKNMHGECMAQYMVQDMRADEQSRLQKARAAKFQKRKEYDIGWKPEFIPSNDGPAAFGSAGMVCLVLDETDLSVRMASTVDPAAAVNLEYLSTALQVRRKEGHEPVFSLEPVNAKDQNSMQQKVFVPDWLEGTSAGDVLFQSDYHLKELSMGEYSQPVIGMKNCQDFSEQDGVDKEWSGREWFIVRKADVALTEDQVLVPRVKMGIEAREQVLRGDELIDVRTTRKSHPLVKYADSFTRNFDLIAERKSVIFHLRELAKASVMAKMLIDGGVNLQGPWFDLVGDVKEICPMEVPQLWNHREHSKIVVNDGNVELADEDGQELHHCQGLYGGVNFGLERAAVSMPSMISRGRLSTTTLSAKPALSATKLAPAASVAAAGVSMPSMISRGRMASLAARPAVGLSAVTAPSVSAAAARPAVGLSSVTAGLARPATGLASVTAGLAPRPAVSLQTSKMMTVTQTRAPGLMPQRPSVGLSAVTTARPAAGLSAVTTRLAAPSRPAAGLSAVTSRLSVAGAARPSAALSAAPTVAARPAIGLGVPAAGLSAKGATALGAMPRVSALGLSSRAAAMGKSLTAPRGVDLNLDQFNLTQAEMMEDEGAFLSQDVSFSIGASFFSTMGIAKGGASCFKEQDAELLRAVFNPNLCDRREEGECFVPPDTRASYVRKLRKLVKEEQEVRAKRTEIFLGTSFVVGDAGPLFPASWTSSFEISRRKAEKGLSAAPGPLHPRSDYGEKAQQIIKSAKAMFDKTTEDGMRFRIYRVGSVEVRTTQMHEEDEVVGAVFSIRDPKSIAGVQNKFAQASERIEKVTEYVERSMSGGEFGFYVVIETEQGNVIVSEKVGTKMTWEENVADLSDRNSLAKVIRTGDCRNSNTTLADVKKERVQLMSGAQAQIMGSDGSRLYAQDMFIATMGGISKVADAYLQKEFDASQK
mmetsp:Transcript_63573/g.116084  ORF Transcript_63573/g.116084 Transcript_63573/m.116084 type:complete len:1237 (+) Transcript_63573:73-3783(+)